MCIKNKYYALITSGVLNPHKTIVTLIYDIKSHNYPTRHEVRLFGNQLINLHWQYVKIVNSINSSFEQSLALMKFHQICHFGFCLHSCDFCRSKIGNQAISSENQTGNRIYLVMLLANRSPKESFHILYLLYMRPSQSQNVYSNLPRLKDVSWREPLINSINLDTLP